mgnify:CR=1 FL=1
MLAALALLPAPSVWARPFTNAAGKTLEAEIVRATASEGTLKKSLPLLRSSSGRGLGISGWLLVAHEVRHLREEGFQRSARPCRHPAFRHGLPHELEPAIPFRLPDPERHMAHA